MRIATFNILHGRSPADGLVKLDRLADAVRTLDADILALQEVDLAQPRSHLADLTGVAADAMGAVSHRFVAAISGTPGATWMAATGSEQPGTASYGIALLSRYPAADWQVFRLPRVPFRFPLYLREPRKMIIVDEEPRAAVVGRFDTPAGRIAAVTMHLSFVPGWNRWQLNRIRRNVRHLEDPLLLLGDLNMRKPQLADFRGLGRQLTFPVDRPTQQLDHILLRGRLGPVTSVSAPDLGLSDHRALVVDISA